MNEGTERERGELGRDMLPSVINSVVVSGATILIAIPLATLAAYAFSRYSFVGNGVLLVWILITQFIPAIVVAIPFFTLFRTLEVFGMAAPGHSPRLDHRQYVDRLALRHLDDQGLCRRLAG